MAETPATPAAPPAAAGGDVVREQDKIQLVLAYLGILSLIPLLTVKDSEYVKWHAKQGLALCIVSFVVSVCIGILGAIIVAILHSGIIGTLFSLLNCVVVLAILVAMVMGIVKAFKPERWRIPVVCMLADKF
jgi:uncharacterized membrane protein